VLDGLYVRNDDNLYAINQILKQKAEANSGDAKTKRRSHSILTSTDSRGKQVAHALGGEAGRREGQAKSAYSGNLGHSGAAQTRLRISSN